MFKQKFVGYISHARGQSCYVNWKIKNFSRPSGEGDEWVSPRFQFCDSTWYLSLLPNEMNDDSDGYITIYLNSDETYISKSNTICVFGVKANSESFYKFCVVTDAFVDENTCYCGSFELLKRQEINKDKNISTDGSITISVLISITSECRVNRDWQATKYDDFAVLSQDFRNLFLSEKNSDVTIKIVDKEFRAHSQVLAARSSVFAPMFTHDMKERNGGIVDIPDCRPEVFRQFLMFLYSGQVEEMSSDYVLDLYCTAEKYDVKELKTRCSDFIKEGMSVDNFCDVISLAIRYNDTELIDYAKQFFVQNIKKIIVTTKWLSFAKEYLVQANELIIAAANRFAPE